MDQERFYTSPMVFQQPFMVPNQSIIYPTQQVFEVPINNYLLIPNGNPQMNQQVQAQAQASTRVVQMQAQPQTQQPQAHQTPQPVQTQLQHQYTQQLQHQQPQPLQHQQPQQQPHQLQLQQHHQHMQQAPAKQAVRSRQASTAASATLYANFNERLASLLPPPPLSKCTDRPNVNFSINQKRAKRKSKFTKKQDEMIIALKKSGKNWVEIAEITKVGSYLAARNRYQVIVGQQGNNNSSSWGSSDKALLKRLLDKYETEKWKFIANELNKATGKTFSYKECQSAVRQLVLQNPLGFMINEDTVNELLKEKKITEKARDSAKEDDFIPNLNYNYEGGEMYY